MLHGFEFRIWTLILRGPFYCVYTNPCLNVYSNSLFHLLVKDVCFLNGISITKTFSFFLKHYLSVSFSRQSLSIHVLSSSAEVFGNCAYFMWTNLTSFSETNWENNEKGLWETCHHPCRPQPDALNVFYCCKSIRHFMNEEIVICKLPGSFLYKYLMVLHNKWVLKVLLNIAKFVAPKRKDASFFS